MVGTFVGHQPVVTVPAPFSTSPTTTEFTLQVIDAEQQVDTAHVDVTVVDTTAPQLSATVSPSCLWSPNHGMVLLRLGTEITAQVTDQCAASSPLVFVKSVTSDQPEMGGGQGSTAPDFRFGSGAACLRSERQGTGARGRTYTITLGARDASGNESTRDVIVTVPHDQSGTKCPRVPASLIVADEDPRCVASVPGAPAVVPPPVPPPMTMTMTSTQPPAGCSPIPCTGSGGPPECQHSDCAKYSFTVFVPGQSASGGIMFTGSFVRSATAGTWSNPLPPERFAYAASETTLITDGGAGPRSQPATCTQQQLVLGQIALKERSSAAESSALTGLLLDGGTWSGVAAP